MTGAMLTLTSIPARQVRTGDVIVMGDVRYTVTENVRGNNGQRHLITETAGGAIVVPERDPGEIVSVWR